MPRRFITRTYIAEGFVHDCEELIQRCSRADALNYHVFCNIWKDMDFYQVFFGRQLSSELAELSEEVLITAKHFLTNNSNIEECIAALFLIYGLMKLQPYQGFAPLRLVPEDVAGIKRLEVAARCNKRYDVLYILGSILIHGPVEYHAQPRDYGFEMAIRKYYKGRNGPAFNPRGVFSRRGEELFLLKEINSLNKKYTQAKAALTNARLWTDKLNYSDDRFAKQLNASFRKVLAGVAQSDYVRNENEDLQSDHDEEINSVDLMQSIKNRAMAITAKTARHLVGLEERKEAEEAAKQPDVPESSLKKGKIYKRKFNLKSLRRKRSKLEIYSGSSDSNLSSEEDDIDEEKAKEETELNIHLDTLPVLISVDRDKDYEIEIIDNMAINNKPIEEKNEVMSEIVSVSNNKKDAKSEELKCNKSKEEINKKNEEKTSDETPKTNIKRPKRKNASKNKTNDDTNSPENKKKKDNSDETQNYNLSPRKSPRVKSNAAKTVLFEKTASTANNVKKKANKEQNNKTDFKKPALVMKTPSRGRRKRK